MRARDEGIDNPQKTHRRPAGQRFAIHSQSRKMMIPADGP